MPKSNNLSGMVIATAAAAIFAGCVHTNEGAIATAKSEEARVKCQGINSCDGSSQCRSAHSSCAGRNHCAGEGWLYADSAQACEAEGGNVIET